MKMRTAAQHAPTPWKYEFKRRMIIDSDVNDIAIVFFNKHSNAELIVRAVNSHEALLEAAKKLVESIKWSGDINQVNLAPKISKLRAVIAQAEAK